MEPRVFLHYISQLRFSTCTRHIVIKLLISVQPVEIVLACALEYTMQEIASFRGASQHITRQMEPYFFSWLCQTLLAPAHLVLCLSKPDIEPRMIAHNLRVKV